MARPRVALVIPTLDEEEAIGGVIAAVPRDAVDEIIVVDSSSRDRTVERAQAAGARVISRSSAATAERAAPASRPLPIATSSSFSTATAAIARS